MPAAAAAAVKGQYAPPYAAAVLCRQSSQDHSSSATQGKAMLSLLLSKDTSSELPCHVLSKKVQADPQHLEMQLTGVEGMPAALLARDGFLFAIVWQTCSRGCNAGTLQMEALRLPAFSASAESCAITMLFTRLEDLSERC